MTAFPDSWSELCLVNIMAEDEEDIEYGALIEDITGLDFGDKDIEIVPTISGGRIVKLIPQAEETFTIKVFDVDTRLGLNGVVQLYHPQTSVDITDPILVKNTRLRKKHRITLLWAVALPTGATVVPTETPCYRVQVINAYLISSKPSFEGKTKMTELTFKWAPFDKDGTENKREESTGSTALPAVTGSAISWS